MKTKKMFTLAIALIITASAIVFASQTQFAVHLLGFSFNTNEATSQIPEHILYDELFRMITSFKKKAESQEMSQEKIIGLKNYFKNRIDLNDEENQILQNVALEYIQEAAPIDAQAGTIIVQTRQAKSNAAISKQQIPPAELTNLQEQKDALALRYRDRLRESLGASGTAKFDEFIKGDFASHLQAIPLSSVNFDQDNKGRSN